MKPAVLFDVNGRAWPHTERFAYDVGEPVRWRVVNLTRRSIRCTCTASISTSRASATGGATRPFAADQMPHVVTQVMQPGGDDDHAVDSRARRQLVVPLSRDAPRLAGLHVDGSPRAQRPARTTPRAAAGMTGLVTGITVRGPAGDTTALDTQPARAHDTADAGEPGNDSAQPTLGFALPDTDGACRHRLPCPGRRSC